jgi:hypothetical protein
MFSSVSSEILLMLQWLYTHVSSFLVVSYVCFKCFI